MAHDVSEYLSFVAKAKVPDQKIVLCMILAISFTMYPISYLFTKYHYVNCYSHRLEVYAVKNGGYKKFREKMFKTHKRKKKVKVIINFAVFNKHLKPSLPPIDLIFGN
jgi:hypothetical protein